MIRPLSPHLQVYKPQLTSVMSILHRITGIGFSLVLLIIVAFLYALMNGEETYLKFCSFFDKSFFKLIATAFSACIYYHLVNGIRYLIWGIGIGLEIKTFYLSGWIVLAIVLVLSALTGFNL